MNPRTASLVRILDGLIELGWLFAILAVPTFFNLRDARIFEPDKIVLLRDIVIVMVVVFLVKAVYTAPYQMLRWSGKLTPDNPGSPGSDVKTWVTHRPIVIAALVFAIVYLLATFDSLLPATSFWGSYDRMEGTYTYLTYITLFMLMVGHMRSWTQFERVATAIIFSSIPCAAYSWVQRFNLDPLVWGGSGPTAAMRTPSTLGNPIFEAAFLLMTVPFTLHRLAQGGVLWWQSPNLRPFAAGSARFYAGMLGYIAALVLQVGAIVFSGSRGPGLGFLAAVVVFCLAIAVRRRVMWLLRTVAVGALVLVAVFGAANTVMKASNTPQSGFSRFLYLLPSESGTSEVRSLLWNSAPSLLKAHPLLGCGPEVLIFCWYPDYPSGLRAIELANAAPDRSHNEDIDIVLTTGILGAMSYLALIAAIVASQIRILLRSVDLRSMTFSAALLAMIIGHIVEAFVGIAFSATILLIWCAAAMSAVLASGELTGAAAAYAPTAAESADSVEPRPAAREGSKSEVSRRQATEGANRSVRRNKDDRRTPQVWGAGANTAPVYSMVDQLARLGRGGVTAFAGGVLVAIALIAVCGAQFIANIELIQADADFRNGQGYEQSAGNLASQTGQMSGAEATYVGAITAYQDAISTLPSWNGNPTYDEYSLFLGKTYLEYANTLYNDLANKVTGSATLAQVESEFQNAADVFVAAAKANPLNPDHPRNLGKLYLEWSGVNSSKPDLQKLETASSYFQQAASLAPHNADIPDEWTLVNMLIGNNYPSLARAQFSQALAHLMRALELYPESGAAYRDLGICLRAVL